MESEFLESFGPKENSDGIHRYPEEVGGEVIATFGMSDATIYNWLKQEKIDRGEIDGLNIDQALELAAAKRRIKQLETELAVSRKVNEVFLERDLPQKGSSR